jgi:histidyl-tRNA synthetase
LLQERLKDVAAGMCENCRRRAKTNPLRVLDCKVEQDQAVIEGLPSILDHLCETCRAHFGEVRSALERRGIVYRVTPRLVRGLDYYTRTTFEVVHGALGAQNSVLGGGRYDGLAEVLGSKVPAPGIGFSIGEDRLVLILEDLKPGAHAHLVDVFIAAMGERAKAESAVLARGLRERGVCVEVAPEGRLKRLMELADRLGARYALIVGDDEIASGTYVLRNMKTGEQEEVSRSQLPERFRSD